MQTYDIETFGQMQRKILKATRELRQLWGQVMAHGRALAYQAQVSGFNTSTEKILSTRLH